jgi:hypothetical protein
VEDVLPHVVKRDGRREPFDRQKLRGSILKACQKQSVAVQAVEDIVADIESKLHDRADKEIASRDLGELVMERLRSSTRSPTCASPPCPAVPDRPVHGRVEGFAKDDKGKAPSRPRALTTRRGAV